MKQSQVGLKGTAACVNTASFFFFLFFVPPVNRPRTLLSDEARSKEGCIAYVTWAAFIWELMTLGV